MAIFLTISERIYSQNYQGNWNGTTDQNEFIYFNVNSSNEIDSIAVRIKVVVTSYYMGKWVNDYCTTTFTNNAHVLIKNNMFETNIMNNDVWYMSGSNQIVKGTFSSSTGCSGKIDNSKITGFSCGGSFVYYSGGTLQSEKTWSAIKTSANVVEVLGSGKPVTFNLLQNYPNPFNPTTAIEFQLPSSSFVTLTVFNSAGNNVATLVEKQYSAGSYRVKWNASGVSSGVYFYRIQAGNYTEMKKMVLMR